MLGFTSSVMTLSIRAWVSTAGESWPLPSEYPTEAAYDGEHERRSYGDGDKSVLLPLVHMITVPFLSSQEARILSRQSGVA